MGAFNDPVEKFEEVVKKPVEKIVEAFKEPVKKNMGGGIGAGINASLGRMNSGINRRVAAMPKQGAPSSMRAPRGPMPSMSTNKSGAKAGLAAQNAVRRAAPMMVKGGPVKKKKK